MQEASLTSVAAGDVSAPARRGGVHIWAPQVSGFGGGISEFSRQTAVATSNEYSVLIISRLDVPDTLKGVPVCGAGKWPASLQSIAFCLNVVRKAFSRPPTLVISTHLNFGPIAFWLRRLTGTPYLLVAHGIDVHGGLSANRLRALQSADRLIAVSHHSRERLMKLDGIASTQVRILPNTVDDGRFTVAGPDPNLKKRHGIPEERSIVLTVGRLAAAEAYKGYDVILAGLCQVLAAIPHVHYVICGKGDDRLRIEKLVAELGLQEHVTLAGFIEDEELPAYYRMADVFAMPSTGEGFGIVFLEAMACGIPVLAGNRDGSVDALADGELGHLVDPLNTNEVAAGLVSLLKHEGPEWWFQPEQLRSRMLARFGRDVFREKLLQIIEEVIAKKNSMGSPTSEHYAAGGR